MKRMLLRFDIWWCRKVLRRTPMHRQPWGDGRYKVGYHPYTGFKRRNGHSTVFIEKGTKQIYV